MAQMRQVFQDLHIAIQQHVVWVQQQAQVTDAAARAQTTAQERADMVRFAAKFAERADDEENKALNQPFGYIGKKDSDCAEWTTKFGSSWDLC